MKKELQLTVNLDTVRAAKDKDIPLLEKAATAHNLKIKVLRSVDMWQENEPPVAAVNLSFLNDQHFRYLRECEIQGTKCLNSVYSSMIADDKALSTLEMKRIGLNVPKTLSLNLSQRDVRIIDKIGDTLGYPCVLKPPRCGLGIGVHLIKDKKEFESLFNLLAYCNIHYQDYFPLLNFIVQEYIPNPNVGLRVIAINGKCIAAAKRTINSDWNLRGTHELDKSIINKTTYTANEISYEKYQIDDNLKQDIEKIQKILKLGFSGVDVMFHKDGYCYNEINTTAGLFKMDALFSELKIIQSIVDYVVNK